MRLKTTIHSLSFALAASVSSFALAQGLGVGIGAGADARLSAGPLTVGVQPDAAVRADTRSSAVAPQTGTVETDMAATARGSSSSNRGRIVSGVATSLNGTAASATDAAGVAAAGAAGKGAAAAASADADAHAAAKKSSSAKAKHLKPATSGGVTTGAEINAKAAAHGS